MHETFCSLWIHTEIQQHLNNSDLCAKVSTGFVSPLSGCERRSIYLIYLFLTVLQEAALSRFLSLHSSSFPKMTMYPKVSKRAHTRSESSTSYRSPVWEVNMKTQLPQSESSVLHRLQKEVKKGVIVRLVIMPYLPRWLLNACFCLFWWNVLTAILFGWEHWGSRLFGGRGCVMHCTLPCLRHPVSLLGMIRWTRVILFSETHISPVATQQPRLHLWHLLCSFLKKSELERSCTYTFCLFWVD